MNELLVEVKNNAYSQTNKISIRAYMKYWLGNYVSINVADTTKRHYEFSITDIIFYLGEMNLNQLRPLYIQKLYSQLLLEKNQSKSTVLKTHRTLNKALK